LLVVAALFAAGLNPALGLFMCGHVKLLANGVNGVIEVVKRTVSLIHPRIGCNRVAQIFNLLYRRIAFCGAHVGATREPMFGALPITNRRYRRLKICATSAGRPRAGLTNIFAK